LDQWGYAKWQSWTWDICCWCYCWWRCRVSRFCSRYRDLCFSRVYWCTGNANWTYVTAFVLLYLVFHLHCCDLKLHLHFTFYPLYLVSRCIFIMHILLCSSSVGFWNAYKIEKSFICVLGSIFNYIFFVWHLIYSRKFGKTMRNFYSAYCRYHTHHGSLMRSTMLLQPIWMY